MENVMNICNGFYIKIITILNYCNFWNNNSDNYTFIYLLSK